MRSFVTPRSCCHASTAPLSVGCCCSQWALPPVPPRARPAACVRVPRYLSTQVLYDTDGASEAERLSLYMIYSRTGAISMELTQTAPDRIARAAQFAAAAPPIACLRWATHYCRVRTPASWAGARPDIGAGPPWEASCVRSFARGFILQVQYPSRVHCTLTSTHVSSCATAWTRRGGHLIILT